jgi:hypothetical protein
MERCQLNMGCTPLVLSIEVYDHKMLVELRANGHTVYVSVSRKKK